MENTAAVPAPCSPTPVKGNFNFDRIVLCIMDGDSRLTDLKSKLVVVSPEVEDDTAGRAEDQRQPHVHSGRGVHGTNYEQDPDIKI